MTTMRTLLPLICMAGLALLPLTGLWAADYPREGQLLTNPGFELDEDEDGLPDGWDTSTDRAVRRESVFMGGNYELASVGDTYVLATQDIELEPGETYTVSFRARGTGPGLAGALIVHGEEQPVREMPLMWKVAVDEEYAEFGRAFTAPNPVARLYIYNVAKEGEVAYDWVSLTKGEPTRVYLNSFDFGERDTPDEEPVVREHTKWATPLAGGPVRALFSIYVYRTVREVVELAQRFEMDYDIIEGGYTGDSLCSPDGRRVMRTMDEDGYEVYVIASKLDERLEEEIRAKVEAGAGLVVISGFGRLGNYCEREALEVVDADHYLMRELPWEYMPAHILNEVRVGRIGEGRVVWLSFPTDVSRVWGVQPVETSHEAYMSREMRYWEYWYAFVARAIHYAARGDLGASLSLAADEAGVVVAGAPEGSTVDVTVRHTRELRWGEDDLSYPTGAAAVDGPVQLDIPPGAPEGNVIADAVVRDGDGGALHWGGVAVDRPQTSEITAIELDQEVYEPGEAVVVTVGCEPEPPQRATLEVRLVDGWGRVVAAANAEAAGARQLGLEPPRQWLLTAGHKLFVKLMLDGREIDSAWTDVYFPAIGNEAPLRDWHVSTWGDGFTNPVVSQQYSAMLMELGLNGKFGSWAYATAETPLIPGIHSHAGRPFTSRATVEDGARVPCLSNPEVIEQYTTEAAEEARESRHLGIFAVNVHDEATLTSRHERREVCFSQWCQARYREWLRDLYGDIGALNAQWGTDYGDFDEITGATTEDVRGTGNFAPFVDFRTFMTDVWVDGMRRITAAYEEGWPGIRVGHTNTFGAMPTNGNDYWKLCTQTGFEWAQEYSEAIKGTAHKAVFELWRSFLQGRTGEDFPNYGWIGYNHSHEAVTYEPWWLAFHDSGGTTYFATNAVSPERGKSWALVYPTQAFTPYSRDVADTIRDLREGVGKALLEGRRADPQVAILWSHPSMLVAWCESEWTQPVPPETEVDDSYGSYFKSAFYFRLALQELQLTYNYVAPQQVLEGELSRYTVLFLPFTCAISDELADALMEWVEDGGTLVADMRLAVTDEHGSPRDGDLLERLMGVARTQPGAVYELAELTGPGGASFETSAREMIEPIGGAQSDAFYADGSPAVIFREVGEGRTIYFNCLLPKYDPVAVEMVGELLGEAGVERRVIVDSGDPENPARAWECARYELGEAEIVGLIRDHRLAEEPQTCTVRLDREAHVYDMRGRTSLGRTDSFEATLAPGEAGAWALLPYQVTGIQVAGAANEMRLTVQADAEVGDHVLHISVSDPEGRARPAYSRNVLARNGVADVRIPLALNDPPGEWTVTARDVLSGRTLQTSFAWSPEQ
ncbi:MAG: beta-galactosidase trimerization domain-containing protein [Armatimonadota bacterium]|nr:beta-galactosidase trimerization domain-containing protein [Armatimonadota bacterium]